MKFLQKLPLPFWYVLACVLFAVAAWFSQGYKHGDEHYQIIEYALYLLGENQVSDLAWEFPNRMRPSLQPWMTAGMIQASRFLGIEDPFRQAFIFRLFSACLLYFSLFRLLSALQLQASKTAVVITYFFCITVFIGARYSSEGLSASFFILTIATLLGAAKFRHYVLVGVVAGLAFQFRYQIAFALVGTLVWMFFAKKISWSSISGYALGFLCVTLLATYLDYSFYQEWTCAPFNYFYLNIVKKAAAFYGVSPWYHYFFRIVELLFIVPGIVFLVALGIYAYKFPKDIFTLTCLFFLLGHMMVGHKEIRFLYPIAPLLAYPLYRLYTTEKGRWYTYASSLLIFINICLLVPYSLLPACMDVKIMHYLEKEYKPQSFLLFFDGRNDPYTDPPLRMHFYKRKEVLPIPQDSIAFRFSETLPAVWITHDCREDGTLVGNGAFRLKKLYQSYPEWLTNLNVFYWVDRTSITTVYQIEKVP
ncbi:MAG: hypothetical protein MUF42_05290 [Cytophagaceae bacterium]|jgi:phosphatidylinositol glycan class B|nr:hypothetical protein [Cytophagaceae bacterium]